MGLLQTGVCIPQKKFGLFKPNSVIEIDKLSWSVEGRCYAGDFEKFQKQITVIYNNGIQKTFAVLDSAEKML